MKSERRLMVSFLLCSAISASGQLNDGRTPETPEKGVPSGTVTGHVYLDDTKAPARRAEVYLEPVASLEADAPPDRSGGSDKGPVTSSVETRFDGSFSFTHVARGAYYVIATCPGYISPFVALLLAEERSSRQDWKALGAVQKANKNRILQALPKVDVQSNLPASIDVVMERGGAVAGSISYDEGGPAAGVKVMILTQIEQGGTKDWTQVDFHSNQFWLMGGFFTDDRGNYRISGLPPGKYVIESDLEFSDTKWYTFASGSGGASSTSHATSLPIYSGNTPRKKEAIGFTLQAGEERTGEDILIPISKLHTIKGNIVSARDGHVVNSGGVVLFNAADRSIAGSQSLTEDDPSFTFSFVFDGEYILSAPASADVDYVPIPRGPGQVGPPQFNTHMRHFYGSASMPLQVDGDMDGVTIAVPEPSAKEAQMYRDAVRQQKTQESITSREPQ